PTTHFYLPRGIKQVGWQRTAAEIIVGHFLSRPPIRSVLAPVDSQRLAPPPPDQRTPEPAHWSNLEPFAIVFAHWAWLSCSGDWE
ncbi:unnamed protein product, partial [Ectocarpus fasciculatus]